MRPLYAGVMGPDRDMSLAATCGRFVVVRPDWFLHDAVQVAGVKRHGLQIIYNILFDEARFLDAAHFRAYCAELAAETHAKGLDVLAVLADEEMYSRLQAGEYDGWHALRGYDWRRDVPAALRLLRDIRDARIRDLRRAFPFRWIGAMENWWSDAPGTFYMPLSQTADFLALDPYVRPPITRAAFDAQVRRAVEHLAPRPLLLIGHAFEDQTTAWTQMPTAEQLGWWTDLAAAQTHVHALAWFLLQVPETHRRQMRGLADRPDCLAVVQAQAARCA